MIEIFKKLDELKDVPLSLSALLAALMMRCEKETFTSIRDITEEEADLMDDILYNFDDLNADKKRGIIIHVIDLLNKHIIDNGYIINFSN